MAAELFIYDEIGPSSWGLIDDRYVIEELSKVADSEPLTVRINSPGGDAFAGISIYNALRRRAGEVTVEIDALAASAASVVAMAGDTIRMASNAHMMIHNAWMIALGNADELEKSVGMLRKIDRSIADTYADRTDTPFEVVSDMMAEETWLSAEEAIASGFANELSDALDIAVSWSDGLNFRHPPEHVRQRAAGFTRQAKADKAYRRKRSDHVNRLIASMKVARRKLGA